MPPGSFGDRQMNIAAGDLYTLSVSFADSSPIGGAFPETRRFPAGGITAGPTVLIGGFPNHSPLTRLSMRSLAYCMAE